MLEDPLLKSSFDYVFKGFDKKSVQNLLRINNHSEEESERISYILFEDYFPKDCSISNAPESFCDVESFLVDSLLKNDIKLFEEYFKKYSTKMINIIELITNNKKEAVKKLEPLVNDLIFKNNAIAQRYDERITLSEKEIMELKLFGIWPPKMIFQRKKATTSDKKLLEKSKIKL